MCPHPGTASLVQSIDVAHPCTHCETITTDVCTYNELFESKGEFVLLVLFINTHLISTHCQHTIDTPYQHTLSAHYRHTLSTHYQHTILTHHINAVYPLTVSTHSHQLTLSTHSVNPSYHIPYEPTLSSPPINPSYHIPYTHPLNTSHQPTLLHTLHRLCSLVHMIMS